MACESLHTKSIGKLMFEDKSLWLSDPERAETNCLNKV